MCKKKIQTDLDKPMSKIKIILTSIGVGILTTLVFIGSIFAAFSSGRKKGNVEVGKGIPEKVSKEMQEKLDANNKEVDSGVEEINSKLFKAKQKLEELKKRLQEEE